MKYSFFFLFIFHNLFSQNTLLPQEPIKENHFGVEILDHFRFLENHQDSVTKKWFQQNQKFSEDLIHNISGNREFIEEIKEFEKRRIQKGIKIVSFTKDNSYYFIKSNQLYLKKSTTNDTIFLWNEKDYKKELGQEYTIDYVKPSWDNKYLALSFTKKGEEISEIVFLDIPNKVLLPEVITNCWPAELGGINWLLDNSGIIYLHIPIIDNKDPQYLKDTESVIYKLGDNPSNHKIIFSKKNNTEFNIISSDFTRLLSFDNQDKYIISTLAGVANAKDYFYAKIEELQNDKINWKPLVKKEQAYKSIIYKDENVYLLSSFNTPNYSIVKINLDKANFENPEVIVPEIANEVIDNFFVTNDGLFYTTTKNGVEAKLYISKNNTSKEIELPFKSGKIDAGILSKYQSEIWINLSGWINPNTRFKLDPTNFKFIEDNINPTPVYPEFKDIVVQEIEIPSHDGKMVPVTIIHKKDFKKNKKNNVILYAYGAYGYKLKPSFQTIYMSWVNKGGIFVLSHVRGGGEKGDNWHKEGFKSTKPNTWKDLIATAEYLIKEKITTPKNLAIMGASAGGIAVGRAVTERPDLFKVFLCNSGDLNPTRIKFAPNGANNMKEFGNPDIEEEFKALVEMDAYQHIKKGVAYPSCLVSVGMNDARVAPWISGKFVAKMRNSTSSSNPIIFSVDYNAGHVNTTDKIIERHANDFAFALWQMGHPDFKIKKKE